MNGAAGGSNASCTGAAVYTRPGIIIIGMAGTGGMFIRFTLIGRAGEFEFECTDDRRLRLRPRSAIASAVTDVIDIRFFVVDVVDAIDVRFVALLMLALRTSSDEEKREEWGDEENGEWGHGDEGDIVLGEWPEAMLCGRSPDIVMTTGSEA